MKIPFLFRFSNKRYKVAIIVMLVLFGIMLILTSVFFNSGKTEVMPSLAPATTIGSYQTVNTYEYGYLYAVIIIAAVVVLLAGWMVIAKLFEKRAFKKATALSNMIFLSERHKMEIDWQNWKMQNRYY